MYCKCLTKMVIEIGITQVTQLACSTAKGAWWYKFQSENQKTEDLEKVFSCRSEGRKKHNSVPYSKPSNRRNPHCSGENGKALCRINFLFNCLQMMGWRSLTLARSNCITQPIPLNAKPLQNHPHSTSQRNFFDHLSRYLCSGHVAS